MTEHIVGIDYDKQFKDAESRAAYQLSIAFSRAAGNASLLYLYGDQWYEEAVNGKPEGKRVVFNGIDSFRIAKDVYGAWIGVTNLSFREKPINERKIFERLFTARVQGTALPLFVPWGVRYEGDSSQAEETAMDYIDSLRQTCDGFNIGTEVLIMPADVYASEINELDPERSMNYWANLSERANGRGYTILPWSQIRSENQDIYDELSTVYSDSKIQSILPEQTIERAFKAARKRSLSADSQTAAFSYLRERFIESDIVERVYEPIKVSMVDPIKDGMLDNELPRLYILPDSLRFPWLK